MSKSLRIGLIGSRGRLGGALARLWPDHFDVTPISRSDLDITDLKALRKRLKKEKFDWVVNCAAQTNVDACESDRAEAEKTNIEAPAAMAEVCDATDSRFFHVSTDYVFDGRQRKPYTEDSPLSPVSFYGKSKAAGEQAALNACAKSIVIRVSWVFGPQKSSFVDMILARAQGDDHVAAIDDKWSSPTYTEDLAEWMKALIDLEAPGGVYHLCNQGECTWREYGEHAIHCAAKAGIALKAKSVQPIHLADMEGFIAERPVYTVLNTSKFQKTTGINPAPWQDAVDRYVHSIVTRGGL